MALSILNQNIAEVLGITDLPLEDQAAFLSEVGDAIFETSLLRLISEFTDEQQQAFEQYLETEPEPDVLLAHLLEHHKDFAVILETVVVEFKEDALNALKQKESDIEIID